MILHGGTFQECKSLHMIRCRARGELSLAVSSVEQEEDRHMAEFHERRRAPRVAVASSPGDLAQRCTAFT